MMVLTVHRYLLCIKIPPWIFVTGLHFFAVYAIDNDICSLE